VLKLSENLIFNDFVSAIPIFDDVDDTGDDEGQLATVSGWGDLEFDGEDSQELRFVQVCKMQ